MRFVTATLLMTFLNRDINFTCYRIVFIDFELNDEKNGNDKSQQHLASLSYFPCTTTSFSVYLFFNSPLNLHENQKLYNTRVTFASQYSTFMAHSNNSDYKEKDAEDEPLESASHAWAAAIASHNQHDSVSPAVQKPLPPFLCFPFFRLLQLLLQIISAMVV